MSALSSPILAVTAEHLCPQICALKPPLPVYLEVQLFEVLRVRGGCEVGYFSGVAP